MVTLTGNLTKADKEMIVLATSAENHCLYCIVAHGALHRIYSKQPLLADQVSQIINMSNENILLQEQRSSLENSIFVMIPLRIFSM